MAEWVLQGYVGTINLPKMYVATLTTYVFELISSADIGYEFIYTMNDFFQTLGES